MDTNGNLRYVNDEELVTMEGLANPVDCVEDIPVEKLVLFRKVDEAGNRNLRKRVAKDLGVLWPEYQIYKKVR